MHLPVVPHLKVIFQTAKVSVALREFFCDLSLQMPGVTESKKRLYGSRETQLGIATSPYQLLRLCEKLNLSNAAAAEFYDSHESCLRPEDIAEAVMFALAQPRHVEIAQLVVLPVS